MDRTAWMIMRRVFDRYIGRALDGNPQTILLRNYYEYTQHYGFAEFMACMEDSGVLVREAEPGLPVLLSVRNLIEMALVENASHNEMIAQYLKQMLRAVITNGSPFDVITNDAAISTLQLRSAPSGRWELPPQRAWHHSDLLSFDFREDRKRLYQLQIRVQRAALFRGKWVLEYFGEDEEAPENYEDGMAQLAEFVNED